MRNSSATILVDIHLPAPPLFTRATLVGLLAFALAAGACTSGVEDNEPAVAPPLSGLSGAIGDVSDLVSWITGATFDESTYETNFDTNFR